MPCTLQTASIYTGHLHALYLTGRIPLYRPLTCPVPHRPHPSTQATYMPCTLQAASPYIGHSHALYVTGRILLYRPLACPVPYRPHPSIQATYMPSTLQNASLYTGHLHAPNITVCRRRRPNEPPSHLLERIKRCQATGGQCMA